MKEYNWKMKSFGKKIDANEAVNEMEKVESIYGSLTPENVVKYAENKETKLRKLFEWNDKKAAYNYRLQQARNILNNIEVKVVSNGENRKIPVYEVVKTNSEKKYKNIENITTDEAEQVKQTTIRELSIIKSKLEIYNNFESVIGHINEAIKELD